MITTDSNIPNPKIIIAGNSGLETAVKRRWPNSTVMGSVTDLALLEYLLSGVTADILVVEPRLKTRGETFEDWMKRLHRSYPNVQVALMTQDDDVDEFSKENPKVLSSQTMVIWSPKGGVGKTFLATNLACAASIATGGNAGLIDLDLYSGDVSVHLDLAEGPTIAEILPVLSDLRPEGLERYSIKHGPSRLSVVTSPRKPELASLVTPENVEQIISLCQRKWGLLYIDTPPDITSDVVGVSVDAATKVVLVVTQDIAALRQCRLACDIFDRLGIPRQATVVVLNRANRDSMVSRDKVEDYLGVRVLGAIPDDRKGVEKAVFEGKPPVMYNRSELGNVIWDILSSLSPGIERPNNRQKNRRRWGVFR